MKNTLGISSHNPRIPYAESIGVAKRLPKRFFIVFDEIWAQLSSQFHRGESERMTYPDRFGVRICHD